MPARIFDGHNDALSRLRAAGPDAAAGFLAGDGAGHLDLPRADGGGLAGGCFAVFTCCPADADFDSEAYFEPVEQPRALAEALAQVALLLRLERDSGGRLRIAREAAGLERDGLAAVLHLEGAEPIGTGARRARGPARRGHALARARLEPAERVRHRRAVRRSRDRPTRGQGSRTPGARSFARAPSYGSSSTSRTSTRAGSGRSPS